MRKISKRFGSKHAFTLVEIVLVIGIIVILAATVFMGITDLMNTASNADSAVTSGSDQLESNIRNKEAELSRYDF